VHTIAKWLVKNPANTNVIPQTRSQPEIEFASGTNLHSITSLDRHFLLTPIAQQCLLFHRRVRIADKQGRSFYCGLLIRQIFASPKGDLPWVGPWGMLEWISEGVSPLIENP
jgi:hypothetical protein